MPTTPIDTRIMRLRAEGNAVVMSVPAALREMLGLKAGDTVIVGAVDGALVARKVDLRRALSEGVSDGGKT